MSNVQTLVVTLADEAPEGLSIELMRGAPGDKEQLEIQASSLVQHLLAYLPYATYAEMRRKFMAGCPDGEVYVRNNGDEVTATLTLKYDDWVRLRDQVCGEFFGESKSPFWAISAIVDIAARERRRAQSDNPQAIGKAESKQRPEQQHRGAGGSGTGDPALLPAFRTAGDSPPDASSSDTGQHDASQRIRQTGSKQSVEAAAGAPEVRADISVEIYLINLCKSMSSRYDAIQISRSKVEAAREALIAAEQEYTAARARYNSNIDELHRITREIPNA